MKRTKDFFISYTSADSEWAKWIAWQLIQDGYEVVIQAWDFRPGTNFIEQMNIALAESKMTIGVLSAAYLRSSYGRAEWTAAFLHDYDAQPRLLFVRIEDVEPPPLLRPWIYIDLVGLDVEEARNALLTGIQSGAVRPSTEPQYPGTAKVSVPVQESPPFPPVAVSVNSPHMTITCSTLRIRRRASSFQPGEAAFTDQSAISNGESGLRDCPTNRFFKSWS
jgi:hypothetical protein